MQLRYLPEPSGSKPKSKLVLKASPPAFVCVPNAVLKSPPIRHRGESADFGISPLEFSIAGACIALARSTRAQARHKYGLSQGKIAIRSLRDLPIRRRYGSALEQFEMAGSAGYDQGIIKFNKTANAAELEVKCNRGALLRLAGGRITRAQVSAEPAYEIE
jgi:hypothetical protein